MQEQIHKLPKVELHSHLEGTIKPALAKEIAQRNDVCLDIIFFTTMEVMHGVTFLVF